MKCAYNGEKSILTEKYKINWIVFTLLLIWQLPQSLLGLIILFFIPNGDIVDVYKVKAFAQNIFFIRTSNNLGISLGKFIFLPYDKDIEYILLHEFGHCYQSLLLGPLYLILIGIPSLYGYLTIKKNSYKYYNRYPERWANKIAKIEYTKKGWKKI